ncbi:fatty acid hydroxylase [Persicimonas caeni]|uniref:Fatty acid hydroxylase n=1 Tax=Persicimonas caeni TaxID=2292766 RepID=A0A4Y6PPQ4_PERCE|nr:sterol desaturase family protein [Persicimonas caeni]QDG50298.1 fatty acid hydroxylase [Persicimonas caeni]QED31519.1 fatty acid hydroxylase [Persicimonas caeni]
MFLIKESPESPRIFDNDVLDGLSRTPWFIVPLLYIPASAGLMWHSVARADVGVLASVGLALAGVLAWTFVEYWLHRTLFHWVPDTSWGETMHFFLHGVHHDWPNDKYRLVMPPAVSILLFFVFLFAWTLLLGDYGWAFHSGFVFGYMCYDVIHYHVHHRRAGFRWLQRLKKHHVSHHFVDDYSELRYGVSTRLWDVVFNTDDLRESHRVQARD